MGKLQQHKIQSSKTKKNENQTFALAFYLSTNCRFIWLYVYKLLCLLSHLHFLFDVLTVFIFPRSKTNSQWNCKTLYILFWQCDSRLLIPLHFLIFWICAHSALVKNKQTKKQRHRPKLCSMINQVLREGWVLTISHF